MSDPSTLLIRPGGLELTKKAVDAVRLTPDSHILDIGCGSGASLVLIRRITGCHTTGIDSSRRMLERAGEALGTEPAVVYNRNDPVNLLQADACSLPFPDASFDFVMMECTLTLFRDPALALREAARVLCPGRWLYISALSRKNPSASDPLVTNGLLNTIRLQESFSDIGFEHNSVSISDQSSSLIQFAADIIFQYGSLDRYISETTRLVDGCIFNGTPSPKETCYVSILAKRRL